MKIVKLVILSLCLAFSLSACSEGLILKEDSLGSLKLSKDTIVSVDILKKHFPEYVVEHSIGQGDSPDFHYFEIKNAKQELLFTISSFIDEDDGVDEIDEEVPISSLEIYSPSIKDQYGISIGMTYQDAIKSRGSDLEFGESHMDNYLGKDNIWYSISVNGKYPTQVKKEEAERGNPKIISISWPYPRWG